MRISLSIALVGFSTVLTGCTAAVPMNAAEDANDPACASVMVRLPDTLDGLSKRETTAQATAAWGEPASILLTCGIEPSGPSALPCVTVNGVDWIRDDANAPVYRFEAYGRQPGLEVIIDSAADAGVSGTNALVDLGPAVSQLEQTRQCVSLVDSLELPPQ